jgi:hypothetical protein
MDCERAAQLNVDDARQTFGFDDTTADPTGGSFVQATPVLAPNGTLYVSTPNGFIHAYGPGSQ